MPAPPQLLAGRADVLKKARLQHGVEYCQTGSSRQRIAVATADQTARLETAGVAAGQQDCQRHTATQSLAERDDAGTHAIQLLGQ
ncbi:hypothetical protein GCM10027514_12220 [Azotobacter armeniacus]